MGPEADGILQKLLNSGRITADEHKQIISHLQLPINKGAAGAQPTDPAQPLAKPRFMGQGDNYFPDIYDPKVKAAELERMQGFGGVLNPKSTSKSSSAPAKESPKASMRSQTSSPGFAKDGHRLSPQEMGQMLGQRMDKKNSSPKKEPKKIAANK